MIVGPTKVKARKFVLSTEGTPEVEKIQFKLREFLASETSTIQMHSILNSNLNS